MNTAEKVTIMWDLFIHRDDTFSEQWISEERGAGYRRVTTGECPNKPPCPRSFCPHVQAVPLTKEDIKQHLIGTKTLGVYQLTEENTVKWACIDVDIVKGAQGTAEELAESVKQQTLKAVRAIARADYNILKALRVENSGNRGYHIWIFFAEPVQARYAFALVNGVLNSIPECEGISYERFPKQTSINGYGNLVKLPLGIHLKSMNRSVFVDNTFTPHKDQWSTLTSIQKITEQTLLSIIKKHDYEVPSSIRIDFSGETNRIGATGLPCFTRAMREGFHEGSRDVGMFRLAVFMRDRGLPYEVAVAAMEKVNEQNHPPLDAYTLQAKIDSGFSGDYGVRPCKLEAIDSYCSSACRFWTKKLDERGIRNDKAKEAVGKISRD